MANVITSSRTYATYDNAVAALQRALNVSDLNNYDYRWCISVHPESRRFVPTLVGAEYVQFAHLGIMVIG